MSLQSLSAHGITWYFSQKPDEADLLQLQRKYHFHKLDIEDCLSENERPKLEEYPRYLFAVIHVPGRTAGRVAKEEVNIFLGKDFVITLTEGKSDALAHLWKSLKQSSKKRDEFLNQGTGFFLYRILDLLFDRGFTLVESMMREMRRIEIDLFEHEEGQINILRDILKLKRNIITMRSILFPQRSVIALLPHKNKDLISADLDIYFDDVSDAIERQWSLLDTAKEMSEALQDTHESWLSNRTNAVIRVLTIFSVTMLPLTFLTGLYGMNVRLPLQESPYAFLWMLCVMVAVLASFIAYFRWKKWL